MRKSLIVLFAVLCLVFAGYAAAVDEVESQVTIEAEAQSQAPTPVAKALNDLPSDLLDSSEVQECLQRRDAGTGLASTLRDLLDPPFLPTTSWNCNGCVEPSPCQTHAECGYPQGVCIMNSCRCICDPDV